MELTTDAHHDHHNNRNNKKSNKSNRNHLRRPHKHLSSPTSPTRKTSTNAITADGSGVGSSSGGGGGATNATTINANMHASKKRRESFAPFAKAAVGCFGVKTKQHHNNNDENVNNRSSLMDVVADVEMNRNENEDIEITVLGMETAVRHHHRYYHNELKKRLRQPRRKVRQTSANDAVSQREQEIMLENHNVVSQPLSLSALPKVDDDDDDVNMPGSSSNNNNDSNNGRQQQPATAKASSSVSIWKKMPSKTRQQRHSRLRSPRTSTLSSSLPSSEPLQQTQVGTQEVHPHATTATTTQTSVASINNNSVAAVAGNTVVAENKQALTNVTTI